MRRSIHELIGHIPSKEDRNSQAINISKRESNQTKSLWEQLVELIDKKEIGEMITRKEILPLIMRNESPATLDKYRCWLTRAGYILEDKRGQYKVAREIGSLTSSECEREAYPHRFEPRRDEKNF